MLDQSRLDSTIEDIWTQWNGIKHVCDWTGWPFLRKPELNAQILLGPNRRILFLTRRNLLRRFISWYISLETGFWGGTKEEFYSKLERVQLESLNPEWVIEQLRHDRDTLSAYSRILVENDIPAMHIVYEHFFRFDATDLEHLDVLNSVLGFLHFEPITLALYRSKWGSYFTRGDDEFSSAEIYRRIPGIERLENEVGSDETGWLFR